MANTKEQNLQRFPPRERAAFLAPAARILLREKASCLVSCYRDDNISKIIQSNKSFKSAVGNTYKEILFVEEKPDIESQYVDLQKDILKYQKRNKRLPHLIAIQNVGLFSASETKSGADSIIQDFLDALMIKKQLRSSFGKSLDKTDKLKTGRAAGKIAIITGSAQGFGKGIAESLAEEGAYVVIADIKETLAKDVAANLCKSCGEGRAMAVAVDVTQEESVKNLMIETVLAYGGIDVFISNAGILNAGSLEEMELKTFELVTKINYSSYYLGAKYASRYMKIQHRFDKNYFSDIIQINSKSGLEGSNKNFAYSGGKFGGIGLTQSFALELIDYNIKVNAICPGNLFEGPLWADSKNGLFAQYLRTKKVPGAKTIADVKRFYENKVPMKRGCTVHDVALAVFYIIEQKYETGQAVPVTGGQVMLS